jgi:hypothetical protein
MSFVTNAIGDLTGTNQQANAARDAAQIQANAAQRAQDLLQQNMSPYMNIGSQAINPYLSLLGLGSQGSAGIMNQLQNMPGYQFALQQGLKGAANSASGSGLNLSGAQQKGLANYSTGLASQTYNSLLGNLANAVNTGQNAAAGTAAGVGNLMTQGANAQAAGTIAQGNAQSNAINSLMGLGQGAAGIYALGNYAPSGGKSMWSQFGGLFGGGGGGGIGGGGQLAMPNMSGFVGGSDLLPAAATDAGTTTSLLDLAAMFA